MRRLLILLLMANLLYALWNGLRPTAQEDVVVTAALPGEERGLVLLSELDHVEALVMENVRPLVCFSIGPFDDEQSLQAFASGHLTAYAWQMQQEQTELPSMHRVYLPAPGSREQALEQLSVVRQAIEGAGLGIDSYLVTSGNLDNAVSLGLFVEEANALSVRRQMDELGMPVQMQLEGRSRNFYSILIETYEDSDFIQETDLGSTPSSSGLAISEKLCEMIAQPE